MQNLENNYIKNKQKFHQEIRNEKRKDQQNEIFFCKDKERKLVEGIE